MRLQRIVPHEQILDPGLISTKIAPLPLRDDRVVRERLIARMPTSGSERVTLVVAPAGYGKTTLLAEWADRLPGPFAWLSLDPNDNEIERFWTYLGSAIIAADCGVTMRATQTAASIREGNSDVALRPLLAELTKLETHLTVFLDEFQEIQDDVVSGSVRFFIEHLPADVHVVIGSRTDPPIPISRLRAQGLLQEIRVQQLEFTKDETEALLGHSSPGGIPNANLEQIYAQTEGWAMGLHLASLSIGETPRIGLASGLSPGKANILDFLREEVLDHFDGQTREFLTQVSILERLHPDLCDAVTDRIGSSRILDELDRSDMFVCKIDSAGRWYRIHSMFAELLRQNLRSWTDERRQQLHRRAAHWFASQGHTDEAIQHAIRAKDWPFAVRLIADLGERILQSNEAGTLHAWLGQIPRQFLEVEPLLCVQLARTQLFTSLNSDFESLLAIAEERATAGNNRKLLASALTLRSFARGYAGQIRSSVDLAKEAISLAGPDAPLERGQALLALGSALTIGDRVRDAEASAIDSYRSSIEAGNPFGACIAVAQMALMQSRKGLVPEGLRYVEEADSLILQHRSTTVFVSELNRSRLYLDAFRLEEAASSIEKAELDCAGTGYRIFITNLQLLKARLFWLQGDVEATLRQIDYARCLLAAIGGAHDFFTPDTLEALVWIYAGRWRDVREWVERTYPPSRTQLGYHEAFVQAKARMWLALKSDDSSTFQKWIEELRRIAAVAADDGRGADLIQCYLAIASAEFAIGEPDRALISLSASMALADRGQFLRPFAEEGPDLMPVIRLAQERGIQSAMVNRLLSTALARFDSPAPQGDTGPLSVREFEILRLLAQGYGNEAIAAELEVSLNTVKTHLAHVYLKLGTKNRTQAVSKARDLKLL